MRTALVQRTFFDRNDSGKLRGRLNYFWARRINRGQDKDVNTRATNIKTFIAIGCTLIILKDGRQRGNFTVNGYRREDLLTFRMFFRGRTYTYITRFVIDRRFISDIGYFLLDRDGSGTLTYHGAIDLGCSEHTLFFGVDLNDFGVLTGFRRDNEGVMFYRRLFKGHFKTFRLHYDLEEARRQRATTFTGIHGAYGGQYFQACGNRIGTLFLDMVYCTLRVLGVRDGTFTFERRYRSQITKDDVGFFGLETLHRLPHWDIFTTTTASWWGVRNCFSDYFFECSLVVTSCSTM